MVEWHEYQEEVADFFSSLGLSADTDVTCQGVRTTHHVDVVVRSTHAGFPVLWVVECKKWRTRVTKEKVLALRTIIDDVGADRGFLIAEGGHQRGAVEAAQLSNVTVTSLADLRATLAPEIGEAMLRSLLNRVDRCGARYWAIDKNDRIELGLRPDVARPGYSGAAVVKAVEFTVRDALRRGYPIRYDRITAALCAAAGGGDLLRGGGAGAAMNAAELYALLDVELAELERRLDDAEARLSRTS